MYPDQSVTDVSVRTPPPPPSPAPPPGFSSRYEPTQPGGGAGEAGGQGLLVWRVAAPSLHLVRVNRRSFLQQLGLAGAVLSLATPLVGQTRASYEFVFARLRYDSGDWDYNPKVCANVLD